MHLFESTNFLVAVSASLQRNGISLVTFLFAVEKKVTRLSEMRILVPINFGLDIQQNNISEISPFRLGGLLFLLKEKVIKKFKSSAQMPKQHRINKNAPS